MPVESLMRLLRLSKGLLIDDIVKAAGLSGPGYYHQIESGRRSVSGEKAKAIASCLGVTVDDLFLPKTFTVRKGHVL